MSKIDLGVVGTVVRQDDMMQGKASQGKATCNFYMIGEDELDHNIAYFICKWANWLNNFFCLPFPSDYIKLFCALQGQEPRKVQNSLGVHAEGGRELHSSVQQRREKLQVLWLYRADNLQGHQKH